MVYFTTNTDLGFYDAISAVCSDTHYKPKICSISWGNAELLWLTSSRTALNSILRHAAQQGISVFAASGDSGSSDGIGDTPAPVDFPGSSPYCVSCGRTNLQIENGLISNEVAWSDEGGGVRGVFPVPSFQEKVPSLPKSINDNKNRRCVPHLASVADPITEFFILVDGSWLVIGGTSGAAPLWAGLIARCNGIFESNLVRAKCVLYFS